MTAVVTSSLTASISADGPAEKCSASATDALNDSKRHDKYRKSLVEGRKVEVGRDGVEKKKSKKVNKITGVALSAEDDTETIMASSNA